MTDYRILLLISLHYLCCYIRMAIDYICGVALVIIDIALPGLNNCIESKAPEQNVVGKSYQLLTHTKVLSVDELLSFLLRFTVCYVILYGTPSDLTSLQL